MTIKTLKFTNTVYNGHHLRVKSGINYAYPNGAKFAIKSVNISNSTYLEMEHKYSI